MTWQAEQARQRGAGAPRPMGDTARLDHHRRAIDVTLSQAASLAHNALHNLLTGVDAVDYQPLHLDTVDALALLTVADTITAGLQTSIADTRALVIADAARATSARQAAEALGLSLATVSKALARAKRLEASR